MGYVVLQKSKLNDFIATLSSEQKVMAPVSKGYNNYAFEQVTSGEQVSMDYIPTILPPKKYFMPQQETIVKYDTSEGQKMEAVVEYEKMTVFGVHTCDIAGISCLNMVFSERPRDLNYLTRKNKIGIIGLECNKKCDEHATCGLMQNFTPNGGYDLFFTDLGDYFMVHVNTNLGDDMVARVNIFDKAEGDHHKALEALRAEKQKVFKSEVDIDHDELTDLLKNTQESKVWEERGKECLACGNCTNVCPTCYCFDMVDDINLDLKTGQRTRVWDSCQHESFATVAGHENFREERSDRQRHRFNRKFYYPVSKFNKYFCTGCGRCTRACMAEISMPATLKQLAKEK
jgi:sulfhydrogenase subunit beta (sulfur reductase)